MFRIELQHFSLFFKQKKVSFLEEKNYLIGKK